MKKQLVIKPEVCIGCRSCELICAFNQTKEFGSISSAITIFEFDASNIIVPLMCMQCEDPHCLKACPVEALTKCEKTGVVSYLRVESSC
jgi:carbon-monoxide dehydrogenase iron sulfur subunit